VRASITLLFLIASSLRTGWRAAMAGLALTASACDESTFIYALPFEPGTEVKVWQDHLRHPGGRQIDVIGVFGTPPYRVVAARPGVVRFIADTFTVNCSSAVGCYNNYVWLEHEPGNEWSKYTHLATGSVTGRAGLAVGASVSAGQYLGDEGNIGMAVGTNDGRHLHFEVVVPDDPATATPSGFAGDFPYTLRIPRFCGVPGGLVVKDSFYVASACP
jgi:murein DD-endopeptidase MepM/ murein hydrolase activator NlpD